MCNAREFATTKDKAVIKSVSVLVSGEIVSFSTATPDKPWVSTYELGRMIGVMQRLGHSNIEVMAKDVFGAKVDIWWKFEDEYFEFGERAQ